MSPYVACYFVCVYTHTLDTYVRASMGQYILLFKFNLYTNKIFR